MTDYLRACRTVYTGLFAWLSSRAVFVSTKVATPLGLLIVLLQITGQGGGPDRTARYLAGACALLVTFGGLFGTTSIVRHARADGILHYAAVSPRSRIWVFTSTLPMTVVDGLLTGTLVLAAAGAVTGSAGHTAWPALLAALAVTACAASLLGLAVAQVELLIPRNTGELTTTVYTLTLALSGAIVPAADMPAWMRTISSIWPMQHSIQAVRSAYTDGTLSGTPLLREALILAVLLGLTLTVTETLRHYGRRTGRAVDPWV